MGSRARPSLATGTESGTGSEFGVYCGAMNSRPLSEHVRRLSAIAERRRAPGAVFCLAVAESRTVPVAYVRRAVAILRSLPR